MFTRGANPELTLQLLEIFEAFNGTASIRENFVNIWKIKISNTHYQNLLKYFHTQENKKQILEALVQGLESGADNPVGTSPQTPEDSLIYYECYRNAQQVSVKFIDQLLQIVESRMPSNLLPSFLRSAKSTSLNQVLEEIQVCKKEVEKESQQLEMLQLLPNK